MSLIDKVDIVLVEPSESGNVGSCARALKNMGFDSFCMVRPQYKDFKQAKKLAVHAQDLLEAARVATSLQEAVAHAHWVVGVSGRARTHPDRKSPIDPDLLIKRLQALPATARTALVFGSESSGLTNQQLGKCQDILCLPTSPGYTSMNLAHAVLVVAWEIRRAQLSGLANLSSGTSDDPATAADIDGLIQHARYTLSLIGYLSSQNPRLILDDLRKVFARAGLDSRESRMLRGIFHCMDVWISKNGGPSTPNQLRKFRSE